MNVVKNGADEIRLWRVGEAIHANIPRSVVREPPVIDHRPNARASVPDHHQLDDLALNILNLFVPPEQGGAAETAPVKCHRGHCSAFAARYHEAFAHAFIEPLPVAGGAIDSAVIVAWIEHCRVHAGRAPVDAAA
jgi:hypothetical protein